MKMQGVRELARSVGVRLTRGSTKARLIQSIQVAEGNFPCFATTYDGYCDQPKCLWREDCFTASRKIQSSG